MATSNLARARWRTSGRLRHRAVLASARFRSAAAATTSATYASPAADHSAISAAVAGGSTGRPDTLCPSTSRTRPVRQSGPSVNQ
jgi:hypothetical protein